MQNFPIMSSDDNIVEVDDSTLMRPSFNISKPPFQSPPSGLMGASLGTDMLINKRKVSSDISSVSQSREGSEADYSSGSGSDVSSSSSEETESRSVSEVSIQEERRNNDMFGQRISNERARMESEFTEKKEILYQMDRLESKGFRLPRKFSMQSDLEEMRAEYHRILREKEVDASIRFQRKMLMAFVTGIEFLNTRFDPFDIRLDGWSEHIQEDLTDYDDIFEELHDKYKATGRKMAPELRLLMSLSGSAFMFHLTNSMFKQQPLPQVEQVLKSNPALMKQFQQAAAQQMYGMQNGSIPLPQQQAAPPQAPQMGGMGGMGGGMGGGLFSMLGGLLGGAANLSRDMPPPPMNTSLNNGGAQNKMRGPNIDNIIDDITQEIQMKPPAMNNSNRMETLSISDEEITSIIEDAADLNGIGNATRKPSTRGRKQGSSVGGRKTLNL
jgi:hypothetical protein